MLEDFVASPGATTDPLWTLAEDCLDHIPEEHLRFSPSHRAKAHIHTWLAWQASPGRPLGLSIRILDHLDPNAQPAQNLIAWVRRVFSA
jgi:hypothetical protein